MIIQNFPLEKHGHTAHISGAIDRDREKQTIRQINKKTRHAETERRSEI